MENWQLLYLALLQGLTEFLPVSSSAHLILLSEALGWGDQGLSYDIALHFGTLFALCWHLRADLYDMALAGGGKPRGVRGRRLWQLLLAGSLPLLLAGLLLRTFAEDNLRHVSVIAMANLFFAALLWRLWQKRTDRLTSPTELPISQALIIGCFQAFAIIPGASRSGLALTGALGVGLQPRAAVAFSFLLAIPALTGAFVLELMHWQQLARVEWSQALLGAAVAAAVALLVLRSLTALIERIGVLPFVLYRLLLGAVLMVFFVRPLLS